MIGTRSGKGRPNVTFTPSSKAWSLRGIEPLIVIHAEDRVELTLN
jgi:hypothetical protein